MNNIDKILKEALDGYEAPFDSTMWDKVSGQLSPMEDAFRNSLENHEAPYNPNAWSAIKNQIGSSWSLTQWISGSAAAIAIISSAIIFWPSNDTINTENLNEPIAANNDAINNTTPNNSNTVIDNSINNLESDKSTNNNSGASNNNVNSNSNNSIKRDLTTAILKDSTNSHSIKLDSGNSKDSIQDSMTKGASISDGMSHTIRTVGNAEFTLSATNICAGSELILNPKVVKPGINHVWDFGDGTFSTEALPKHSYTRGGLYEISHSIKDKSTNKLIATEKEMVSVKELPTVDYTWNQDYDYVPILNFTSSVENSGSYMWTVDNQLISDKKQFEYTFRSQGTHVVKLTNTNEAGCSNSIEKKINIEDNYNLLAPSAFTPNGDNINNEFIPKALLVMNCEFKMLILDKNGTLIFETNNTNNQWNGRSQISGTDAESGMYVWIVTLKNGNGTFEKYEGQVLLVR